MAEKVVLELAKTERVRQELLEHSASQARGGHFRTWPVRAWRVRAWRVRAWPVRA